MVTEADMFDPGQNQYIKGSDSAGIGFDRPAYEGDGIAPEYHQGYDNGLWSNITKPTSYEYMGRRGGADAEETRYLGLAAQADKRAGPQIDTTRYNQDRSLDFTARSNEKYAINQYREAMAGRGPSAAQGQMGLGLLQARQQNANALQAAQQSSGALAAGARGGGANLAAAQMQAARVQGNQLAAANQSGAQLAQQSVVQAAGQRAQEQQQAMQGFSGVTSQQRGQDIQREQLSAEQANRQAQLDQGQHALNDARNMGYQQMRQRTFEDQLQAQQAGEAANAGAFMGRWQQQSQDKANQNSSYWGFGGLFR